VSESVWSYPRPPRVEASKRRVRVVFDGITIADSTRALRVLETSHPPVYYIPSEDVRQDALQPSRRHTVCEFKGTADYHTLAGPGRVSKDAAWSYPHPAPGYESLAGYLALYPERVDACYGGWVTKDITGPFKGGPGTGGW